MKYQRLQTAILQDLKSVEARVTQLAFEAKTELERIDADVAKLEDEKLKLTEELKQFAWLTWW